MKTRNAHSPHQPCVVCGGSDVRTVSERDRHGAPLSSVMCLACGLVWVDPPPDAEALQTFYAQDYRRRYKGAYRPKPKHCYRETVNAIRRAAQLMPLYRPGMRVLDVGAGAGFFPYVMRSRGVVVDGIEPNRSYADYARNELGVDSMRTGFLADLPCRADYDLVTIHHVFEHLANPADALRHMHGLLREGGRVLMEVPNIEATYHAPHRTFHIGHLYWYNDATLKALALRHDFSVESCSIEPRTRHVAVVLRKVPDPDAQAKAAALLCGNAQRVATVLGRHTLLRHYLSAVPYRRFLHKARLYWREQAAVWGRESGRRICDAACARWHSEG